MSSLFYKKKITSRACLLGSGLNVILHWPAQAFILLKSLLKLVVDKFRLLTIEKRKMSAKSLTSVLRPSERSLCRSKITIGQG